MGHVVEGNEPSAGLCTVVLFSGLLSQDVEDE